MTMMGVYTKTVSFTASSTTSTSVDCEGGALVGAVLPASMLGTSLQLEASLTDTGTMLPVFDSTGARVAATISTNASYRLFPQT